MELDRLFQERDNWQKDAFNNIKKDLLSIRGDKAVQYDNVLEKHLVSIYGKPQTGKTTLILNMLGLKDENSLNEVYETLRGGVRMGNSSTATAIIYSKSPDDRYGLSVSTMDGKIVSDIVFVRKEEMILKIEEIRSKVETNRMDASGIVRIMIPNSYFIPDNVSDQIAILDLPGFNSSNIKERPHVETLMAKFIPVSSVCIILWESSDIQGLEKLILPTGVSWKNLPHRFMVVVSHAFNDDNTRRYFRTEKEKREEPFYTYVYDIYREKIRDILGLGNRTEVFPIEVGQSLSTLCTDYLEYDCDREEVRSTKNRVLSDLRTSILNHKGQRLSSALEDLRSLVEKFDNLIIKQYEIDIEEHQDRINTYNAQIKKAREIIETLKTEIKEEKEHIGSLKTLRSQLESLVKEQEIVEQYCSYVTQSIKEGIRQSILSVKGLDQTDWDMVNIGAAEEYIICDGEGKCVLSSIKAGAISLINDIKKIDVMRDDEIQAVKHKRNPSYAVFRYLDKKVDIQLYPKRSILKRIFSNYKISTVTIQDVCHEASRKLCKEVEKSIIKPRQKVIDTIITESENREIQRVSLLESKEQSIKTANDEITSNELKIQDCRTGIEATKSRRQKDISTLHCFIDYTRSAFKKQREEILARINKAETKADDKVRLLLLLGLITKDYESITVSDYGQAD